MTSARSVAREEHEHAAEHSSMGLRAHCFSAPGENRLLNMVASGRPVSQILEAVCRAAEDVVQGSRCGIYLIDWSGAGVWSFSAPGLPAEFNVAVSGLPLRHDTGPCARAALFKVPVIAADLESDPLWRGSAFHTVAESQGFRSCWSMPICSTADEVLGTLAILNREPGSPTLSQVDLVSELGHIAGISIERKRVEAELSRTNAELARAMEIMALGASIAGELTEPLSGVVINASTGLRMLSACPPNVDGARETIRRTLRDCDRASEMITQLRDLLGSKRRTAYHLRGTLRPT